MTAGYSGTPLIRKLGIKPGDIIALIHAPDDYDPTLGTLPDSVQVTGQITGQTEYFDFIQAFFVNVANCENEFLQLKHAMKKSGMLWISWPKKASRVPTDLNENLIREIGLANGLVDVRVAAVDQVWSGLKFVYRVADR